MKVNNYCIEVTLNGSTCLLNFTKIHRSVQKLLVGDTQTDRQTDRQTHTHRQAGDLISPLSFFESRLKMFYTESVAAAYKARGFQL
jgi:hypothetical protein